jgi:hypothetical protein
LYLPTTSFLPTLDSRGQSIAAQLLKKYPGPLIDSQTYIAPLSMEAPVVVNRLLALDRGDYSTKSAKDRVMARLVLDRFKEPDFSWSPYPDFITPLDQNTTGIAGNWTRSWTPRLTHELKLNYSDDNLWWDRAHPEIPTLASGDQVTLPGSSSTPTAIAIARSRPSTLPSGRAGVTLSRPGAACFCDSTAATSPLVRAVNMRSPT